jgi:hypothetical protein
VWRAMRAGGAGECLRMEKQGQRVRFRAGVGDVMQSSNAQGHAEDSPVASSDPKYPHTRQAGFRTSHAAHLSRG